jgi:hypothetical protein
MKIAVFIPFLIAMTSCAIPSSDQVPAIPLTDYRPITARCILDPESSEICDTLLPSLRAMAQSICAAGPCSPALLHMAGEVFRNARDNNLEKSKNE